MTAQDNNILTDTSDREMVLTRVVDAPREIVWKAWTDPEQIVKWWGPNGFSNTLYEMDVKPGGVWRHMMHGPDGTDYTNKVVYLEVVKPEKLVYSHGDDKEGSACQFHVTVTFEEIDQKTKVTLRMLFESIEEHDKTVNFGAIEGGNQTLGRLAEYLEKNSSKNIKFIITRTLNAPRDIVWNAWTDQEQLQKWFGPKGWPIFYAKLDLSVGGIYHYGLKVPNGEEMWGKWVFKEIEKPSRLVWGLYFSDSTGEKITRHPLSPTWPLEMQTTVLFEEDNGKTKVTLISEAFNTTEEERQAWEDGMKGMNIGWGGTFEQLETFLEEL
jgi:uncharacterized protein YndB with AHSA1/START domain